MSAMTRDDEHVVCPHCQYGHGDAWEWCTSEIPQLIHCDECGKPFKAWAEYDVQYVTTAVPGLITQPPETPNG
ncbi:hypothetical protein [Mameliella alba]|uniref:hypothetical protein n=1 Tax=Mameliella alba TaxID=561184 RepID=UPI000B5309D8|nr:hypothetical protein [Mameliella alba]OWV44239.1 hypothetical protein CDZ95_06015 [Mameliella alba]